MFNIFKNIIVIPIMLTIILTGCAFAKVTENEKFVAVTHTLSTKTGDVGTPKLMPSGGFKTKVEQLDGKVVITSTMNILSHEECQKVVTKNISTLKEDIHKTKQNDFRYNASRASIFEKSYIIEEVSQQADVYYCVPLNIWNQIKPYTSDTKSSKNIERYGEKDRFKDSDSFFSIMKKCGISEYSFFHINTPETPFVCDKYTEDNPVLFKTYDELINGRYKK